MNLIEIAEQLKDVPDQYLLQEVQRPTGNYPSYLVVSELGRRKRMRESVAKEAPKTTVAEDLTAPQRQQAMAQMAQMMQQQPMQPQDQNMIPQAGGLNALPQAQQDLAAMDMVSAQPQMPPQMPEVPAMAGGGMVSFRQGGDVIRAFDGLPDEFFTSSTDQPSMSRGELTDLMTLPELQEYNRSGVVPERLRSTVGTTPIESGSFIGGLPFSRAPAQFPVAAVAPAPRPVATATTTPSSAPSGAPAPADQTRPSVPPLALRQTGGLPQPLTDYAIQTARAQRLADYEQAVPDTLKGMFGEQIERREKDIAARRASNINEALMRAGLGIMASKSPRFLQAAGEGGMAGLGTFREGLKDIRQSEELNTAARMKMAEAEMLRGERKFKAADDAERSARDNQRDAVALANTESAMALRDLQGQIAAQKAPFDIAESQARAAAYGARGVVKPMTAEERMLLEPQAVARLKRRGISSPTDAQIDAEIAALRGMSSAEPATALDRGTI